MTARLPTLPPNSGENNPHFFRAVPAAGGRPFVIVSGNGLLIDPPRTYRTEDKANDAIGKMIADDDEDRRLNRGRHERAYYERLAEEEASSRGYPISVSAGASSAGRS